MAWTHNPLTNCLHDAALSEWLKSVSAASKHTAAWGALPTTMADLESGDSENRVQRRLILQAAWLRDRGLLTDAELRLKAGDDFGRSMQVVWYSPAIDRALCQENVRVPEVTREDS